MQENVSASYNGIMKRKHRSVLKTTSGAAGSWYGGTWSRLRRHGFTAMLQWRLTSLFARLCDAVFRRHATLVLPSVRHVAAKSFSSWTTGTITSVHRCDTLGISLMSGLLQLARKQCKRPVGICAHKGRGQSLVCAVLPPSLRWLGRESSQQCMYSPLLLLNP